MIQNDLLRKAVRVEYTLLRTPLVVLDERVVSRSVPGGAVVHTSLTRTISVLDTVAERLLSEPPEASAPFEDVAPAPESAPFDDVAPGPDTAPADAPSEADTGEPAPLPDEEREGVEQLAAEILEAEEEQTFVGELAADEELRRVQAELRAKHTVEEREESP